MDENDKVRKDMRQLFQFVKVYEQKRDFCWSVYNELKQKME